MSNKAMNWAESLDLPKGQKAVLRAMANDANAYMAVWTSREKLGEKTGYKQQTIRDYQNEMATAGVLIIVPWQTDKGADASPSFFLGCVDELFDARPPAEVAFGRRINFRGKGRGGHPRGFVPQWWSGERTTGSAEDGQHRCSVCGEVCHQAPTEDGASEGADQQQDADSVDPGGSERGNPVGGGESTLEGRNQPTLQGRNDGETEEPSPAVSGSEIDPGEGRSPNTASAGSDAGVEVASFDPGEGGLESTLEGRNDTTPVGGCDFDPFNPKVLTPKEVTERAASYKALAAPRGTAAFDPADPAGDAAFADAAAGDGLRPRGFAAPGGEADGVGDEAGANPAPALVASEPGAPVADRELIATVLDSMSVAEKDDLFYRLRMADTPFVRRFNKLVEHEGLATRVPIQLRLALEGRPLAEWPQGCLPEALRVAEHSPESDPDPRLEPQEAGTP